MQSFIEWTGLSGDCYVYFRIAAVILVIIAGYALVKNAEVFELYGLAKAKRFVKGLFTKH